VAAEAEVMARLHEATIEAIWVQQLLKGKHIAIDMDSANPKTISILTDNKEASDLTKTTSPH